MIDAILILLVALQPATDASPEAIPPPYRLTPPFALEHREGDTLPLDVVVSVGYRRLRETEQLQRILEKAPSQYEQWCAMFLCGRERFGELAPLLARDIATTDDKTTYREDREVPWGRHPAAEALVRIGMPAVKPVLSNIATSDAADVRQLSLQVLLTIEDKDVAKFMLAREAKAATDASVRARLEKGIQAIDGLEPIELPGA